MECPICLRNYGSKKTITLKCQHKYCIECLKKFTKMQSKTFGGRFKCPQPDCNSIFSPDGLIGKRLIKDHDQRNSRMSAYPCPFKKCKGTLNKDANCVKCQKQACGICLEKPHLGNCNTEIVNSINSVYKNKAIKFCPHCKTAISKNGGCISMVCMKCGTNFNWNNMHINKIYNFDHYEDRIQPGIQNNQIIYPYPTRINNYKTMNYELDMFEGITNCIDCGLDICMIDNNTTCCWCRDNRINKSQIIYDDDLGLIETNKYWNDYCPTCKSIENLKLEGLLVLD
jgi:hypothetical protein